MEMLNYCCLGSDRTKKNNNPRHFACQALLKFPREEKPGIPSQTIKHSKNKWELPWKEMHYTPDSDLQNMKYHVNVCSSSNQNTARCSRDLTQLSTELRRMSRGLNVRLGLRSLKQIWTTTVAFGHKRNTAWLQMTRADILVSSRKPRGQKGQKRFHSWNTAAF